MKRRNFSLLLGVVWCLLTALTPHVTLAEAPIDDAAALQGCRSAKALFDLNVSKASKLELYLRVIKQTHEDLVRQGVTPEMVIAFRGASVRLITTENWAFSEEEQGLLRKSAATLKELQQLGARVEACSIATRLFAVDNKKLLPGVKVVGNTFVSLIGYQGQGYSLIPIQ